MSEAAAGPPAPAAERGRLEVAERVVEKTVTQAAREITGLVSTGSSVPLGLGSSYPSSSVSLRETGAGQKARIRLQVAAPWPCQAQAVVDDVRRRVTDRTRALVGVEVERLDVTLHVVTTDPERVR